MRLASFQERATSACRARWRCWHSSDAGTGSGKTIAFYYSYAVDRKEAIGPDCWVKALAVYPRVELLRTSS